MSFALNNCWTPDAGGSEKNASDVEFLKSALRYWLRSNYFHTTERLVRSFLRRCYRFYLTALVASQLPFPNLTACAADFIARLRLV